MPSHCPSCQRLIYSGQLSHCGYCGALIPDTTDPALREAIHDRQVEHVRSLLANGVNFSSTDRKGMTPLMFAAEVGSPEIVELLLAAGADPTPKDNLGYTAQDLAYWHGEYHMGSYTPESLRIVEMLKRATPRDKA